MKIMDSGGAACPLFPLIQAERNEMKEVLGSIAEAYRVGVKRNVRGGK